MKPQLSSPKPTTLLPPEAFQLMFSEEEKPINTSGNLRSRIHCSVAHIKLFWYDPEMQVNSPVFTQIFINSCYIRTEHFILTVYVLNKNLLLYVTFCFMFTHHSTSNLVELKNQYQYLDLL
jgi:hypothetical protein